MVCQTSIKINQNIVVTELPLRLPVIIADVSFGNQNLVTIARKDIFALWAVMLPTAKKLCPPKNNLLGEVGLVILRRTADGKRKILNAWYFSRQGDTLARRVLKGNIPLKNGRNLRRNRATNVLFVENVKNLLKTILFRCLREARIIYLTFRHYVVIAIARNGNIKLDYFNIYENPELLEELK